jgi:hypothetical protein
MKPGHIALGLIIISLTLAMAFLTGCKTLGVSLHTDYGKFSYQLPELPKPTSSK